MQGVDDSEEGQTRSIITPPDAQSHYSTPRASNSPVNPTMTSDRVPSSSNGSSSIISATAGPRNHSAVELSLRDPRGAITTQPTIQRSLTQPISLASNNLIDPPPPPYPGLSRNEEQRAAAIAALSRLNQPSLPRITEDDNRNINVNRIPTITFEDSRNQYTGIMNWSLCLLVLCLLLCNISSLFFTVPAVISSWVSVRADMNYQHGKAMKAKKVAVVCNWIVVGNFVIVFVCGCLALGIYLLVRNEFVSVNFK